LETHAVVKASVSVRTIIHPRQCQYRKTKAADVREAGAAMVLWRSRVRLRALAITIPAAIPVAAARMRSKDKLD
jgi:hypothetical protein